MGLYTRCFRPRTISHRTCGAPKLGLSSGIALVAFCTTVVCSTAPLRAEHSRVAVDLARLTIPPEDGHLIETHPGNTPDAPVVIHIQEAHANASCQQHLLAILEHLIKQHNLRLILVEGGAGKASLQYVRRYADLPRRKQVADQYLKAGLLSAEEYLEIASDYPVTIWGVEDRELYNRQGRLMADAEPLRQSLTPILAQLRTAADQLRTRLLSPELQRLEEARETFEREDGSLTDYLHFLVRVARQQQLALTPYGEVRRFLALSRQQQRVDLNVVEEEQKTLLRRLQRIADRPALNRLAATARAVKAKTEPEEHFYDALADLATQHGLALTEYPHLKLYRIYLRGSKRLRLDALSKQIEALASALRMQLSETAPEARQLVTLLDELALIEQLVKFELSPEGYQRFVTLETAGLVPRWVQFLNAQFQAQGLAMPSWPACESCDAMIAEVAQFYTLAGLRDQALADRAIAKLQESKEPLAVLITGGFHSPQMTRVLKERGLAVLVVTPQIEDGGNPAVYDAALKYRQGQISLEQAMAVANPSGARGVSSR